VFKSMQRPGAMSRISAATAVAVAAIGLTACATSGDAPATTPTATITQAAQASPAPAVSSPTAAPSAAASGSADSPSAAELPEYQPSTVVSKSAYSTVLTSPDPVSKIGEFYQSALTTGGWHVVASSMSAYHASFTAYRSHEGVSVSVYSRGSGSGISISMHPQ
jgi:hypothetical protein